jgi:hypothetical protein
LQKEVNGYSPKNWMRNFENYCTKKKIINRYILKQQILLKIPEPVFVLITDYFQRCLKANEKIKFHGPLKKRDAIVLF